MTIKPIQKLIKSKAVIFQYEQKLIQSKLTKANRDIPNGTCEQFSRFIIGLPSSNATKKGFISGKANAARFFVRKKREKDKNTRSTFLSSLVKWMAGKGLKNNEEAMQLRVEIVSYMCYFLCKWQVCIFFKTKEKQKKQKEHVICVKIFYVGILNVILISVSTV